MTSPSVSAPRVAVLGNVGPDSPEFSTENEWVRAYEHRGIDTVPFREEFVEEWVRLIALLRSSDKPTYVHWTSTPPWRLAIPREIQNEMLWAARGAGVPVVGIHLDRFWSIRDREKWIMSGDPYFKVDLLFTADGGNEDKWASMKINHRWLLPGVGERWCHRGEVRDEYRSEVAFVGSWYRYHHESRHRTELIAYLKKHFKTNLFPQKRQHAIRGDELTDLYWSVDVAVGDSFFPSRGHQQPPCCYSSDRITESLGRGAMFVHPKVEGITDGPFDVPSLSTWTAWRWQELRRTIEENLNLTPSVRTRRRNAGIAHIKKYHTYEVRVQEVMDTLVKEGLI